MADWFPPGVWGITWRSRGRGCFHDIDADLLAALLAGGGYLALRYMTLGVRRRIGDLEPSIRQFMQLPDPRLSLVVREFWGDRFLQFRAARPVGGDASVELWLPKPGWSERLEPWITRKCVDLGVTDRTFIQDDRRHYTVISFGPDWAKAARFAADLLVDQLGLAPERKVFVRVDVHA